MPRKRIPKASDGATQAPNHDRWLLSYADFITLLLAVFVVLYVSSHPDKLKAQQVASAVKAALRMPAVPPAPPAAPTLAPSIAALKQTLSEEIAAGKVDVRPDTRGLVISLRQEAYFPSGGDEIAPSGYASIGKIAGVIASLPNAVQLEGHTDATPIHTRRFRSNWELSAARSIAMLELFARDYGLDRNRFAVAGYAETKPVDSNETEEGRAHNRRVDIVILNQPA